MTADCIKVRKFRPGDAKEMMKWGKHDDLRFLHYNYPYETSLEHLLWYRSKTKFFSKRLFAIVKDDKEIIGYIILKKIDWINRMGEMGIAVDYNYMNHGYGSKAIIDFLDIIFNKMKFRKVWLRTSDFNVRAQKSYEKVGFKLVDKYMDEFEEQSEAFNLVLTYDYFKMIGTKAHTLYHFMEITREEYNKKYDKE